MMFLLMAGSNSGDLFSRQGRQATLSAKIVADGVLN
jgi:hypothetical protein